MLRRKPSRVEERADVSDEYEFYLREKKRRQQQRAGGSPSEAEVSASAEQQAAELARQRRDNMRARLGLSSTPSMG